jgi:hypothetical protein
MPANKLCHGHAGPFTHTHGADLHCSSECAGQHRAAQQIFEKALTDAGFNQVKEIPNLWERDGVRISIEQVMREGMDETLARHRSASRKKRL